MVASTFMPGRRTRPLAWSIRIFTGMRCTTFTKLPVAFSGGDRKSTRLNSSHLGISYAVFCLKKINILIHLPAAWLPVYAGLTHVFQFNRGKVKVGKEFVKRTTMPANSRIAVFFFKIDRHTLQFTFFPPHGPIGN